MDVNGHLCLFFNRSFTDHSIVLYQMANRWVENFGNHTEVIRVVGVVDRYPNWYHCYTTYNTQCTTIHSALQYTVHYNTQCTVASSGRFRAWKNPVCSGGSAVTVALPSILGDATLEFTRGIPCGSRTAVV